MGETDKVFSEQESAEILQRAARMQEAANDASYAPGVTRKELERIAVEAGIDPKYLARALTESESETVRKGWLNLSEEYERVIEGEVDPSDYDQILLGLKPSGRNSMNVPMVVGRTVSMQTFYQGAMCYVEMTSRKGRTRIKVRSVPFMAYFLSLHPALIFGLVLSINLGVRVGALAALLTFFGFMIAGIAGFAGLTKKGHRSAKNLIDLLQKRAIENTESLREELARPQSHTPAPEIENVIQDMPG